ncbi:TetR/AcrR family transcriptional regulator [Mycobacterium parmense]|nr:TetR/AcrR family transcriptional regulator [Mycobacterium parmense]MCV7348728.1 TetR/AcrR family transcriptional regulator [Mycobacterium parmense]ORW49608.1 TetR family transcriptional regulator [Mycobacterium parmense]
MLAVMSPVKPPRTRPTRPEVRDRILDAASKVFAAEGFAGATIDAIGQAAGFTKGAVYSNFGSKDELFLTLLDREFGVRGERIATALDSGDGDTVATARALSRSVLEGVQARADYHVLFVEYWLRAMRDPNLRERLIARRRAAVEQAAQVVGQTATMAPGRRLADLAQLVVSINLGIGMEEVLRPGTVDPDLLTQLIAGLLESASVTPARPHRETDS